MKWLLIVLVLFVASCATSREQEEKWAAEGLWYYQEDAVPDEGVTDTPYYDRVDSLGGTLNYYRAQNNKELITPQEIQSGDWMKQYPKLMEEGSGE